MKFELSHVALHEILISSRHYQGNIVSAMASTDPMRARIFEEILNTYSNAQDAQSILSTFDSLKTSNHEFVQGNQDVRSIFNLAEESVYYWTGSVNGIGLSKRDPLTPRQRQISNADADGAIDGAIGGFLLSPPGSNLFGAVAGCIVGGAIGSIRKAIELN